MLWSTISNELPGRDGHASPIKNSTLSDRGRPAASVPGPNSELGQDDSLGLEGDSWLSDGPLDSLKSPRAAQTMVGFEERISRLQNLVSRIDSLGRLAAAQMLET